MIKRKNYDHKCMGRRGKRGMKGEPGDPGTPFDYGNKDVGKLEGIWLKGPIGPPGKPGFQVKKGEKETR
ncbi:hypothetical protein CEXT_736141 [Caerostris extrusa]|uniref:Uncharacterized protein n=1 Tax=Caerostris extrusa TaxID=172846 RepID=A0AAV4MVY1_CAEEX|nr:hypothetical protein CEXT_736141 [Caerostris extrusa]